MKDDCMRIGVISWCIVVSLGLILAGCGKPKFPKVPVEPIKEFSLGSAKFQPFAKRPTGQELFNRTLEFYDTFNSAAVSWHQREHYFEGKPAEPGGGIENLKETTGNANIELRYVRQEKLLYKRNGDSPLTEVINGNVHLFYVPEQEICFRSRPGVKNEMPPHAFARFLDFVPRNGREYSSFKLLKDTKVGDSEVYLLEVRLPSKAVSTGVLPAEVRRFYIGKSDLLLRRVEINEIRDEAIGNTSGSRRIYQFSGFVVNPKLSDDLFPTECPKNIRVATMPSSGLPR